MTEQPGHCNVPPGVTTPEDTALAAALKLVARHYYREGAGAFVYEAFEHINATYFEGQLPYPLIVWTLTPHGGCLGMTHCNLVAPIVKLHPSLMGGTERDDPWGMAPTRLGPLYAYEVLLHECIHLAVEMQGGWRDCGESSHNNPLWVAEVNRIAPMIGLGGIQAGMQKPKRVAIEGKTTKTGKVATRVQRVCDGNVPFAAVARFPAGVRVHLGQEDYYLGTVPYSSAYIDQGGRTPTSEEAATLAQAQATWQEAEAMLKDKELDRWSRLRWTEARTAAATKLAALRRIIQSAAQPGDVLPTVASNTTGDTDQGVA